MIGLFLFLFFALSGAEIAVATLAVGDHYKDIVQQGIDNKQFYCKKHGYDFVCSDKVLDPSRPIVWSKILLLLKIMENDEYKWIFWTDADSLVMNHAVSLENLIDDDYNFIIAKDINGINNGQFLIKNCSWSRQFLQNIYAHTECLQHLWQEQQAMVVEYNQNPDVVMRTKIVPQRLFNSYPEEIAIPRFRLIKSILHKLFNVYQKEIGIPKSDIIYQPGDFIVHFPSARKNRLRFLFNKYAPLSSCD